MGVRAARQASRGPGMLDEKHRNLERNLANDENLYVLGSIGKHNVVIVCLPAGCIGNNPAAAVATQMRATFKAIQFGLTVGIGGGVPSATADIRLGDVVVSQPYGTISGVVQYDMRKTTPSGFERTGSLNAPPQILLAALARVQANEMLGERTTSQRVSKLERNVMFKRSRAGPDILYNAEYDHEGGQTCDRCSSKGQEIQPPRESGEEIRVHHGTIASGNQVMKNATERDKVSTELSNVLCFEMEAAGLMNSFPCLVVRGICDYADSHKNKTWQPYAAATAAAYAKEVLLTIPPTEVTRVRTVDTTTREESGHMTTPKYYLYFPKNRYFVKRQNELNELNQKLPRDQDCQKLTILGLGGTGKTQVALQFAYLVKETQPEWSVFWVSALSMDSFDRTCLKIAQELKIPQAADQEEDVKELVKQYLSSNKAGRWLLVVDNADDPDIFFGTRRLEGIHGYLPESDGGVIVYTTRTPEVAELTCGDVLEVGVMDHQDAIIFLTKSLTRKTLLSNVAIANELLKELTYLPLAIAQAAAYLNKNRMPVAKYLRLLRNTENDIVSLMSREFRDNTRYKESANAVADTWIVSFSQIREHHKVAADLLAFMSCIEWKAIPRSLLPCMQSEVEMEDAIGTLCGYSFLTKRSDDTRDDDAQEFREESDESVGEEEGWYDIYRLVHLATNICVSEHGTAATVTEEAVRHVTEVFPWDEYESREVWRMYLPHTLRLLGSSRDYSSEQKSKLCLKVGRCLQLDGKIRDAVTWLEESCRLRDGLDEANQDRLNAQHVLARAYQEDGHMQEAVELLEHIVGVDGKLLDGNDSDRLASQHALAVAYYADGHVQMATKLLEHVVRVREVLAKEHPSQQASQHNLAIAYKADGRLQKAMELMEHVVAVEARTLRDDHPSRVVSAEMLADWYADLAVE